MAGPDYKSMYEGPAAALALQQGIPSQLFRNLIESESSWNPYAVGSLLPDGDRATGIAQFRKGTAEMLGLKNRTDPWGSLKASATYMKRLYDRYGNWPEAVAAYKGYSNVQQGAQSDIVKKVVGEEESKEYQAKKDAVGSSEPKKKSISDVNPDPIWKWGANDWRNFFARSAVGLVLFGVGVLLILWSLYAVIMRTRAGSTVVKVAAGLRGTLKGS